MTLKRFFNFFYYNYLLKTNPEKYAKKVGVNLLGKVYFYDLKVGDFGSEPWMITIGDNVHITSGCKFVTHDGGTLILRRFQKDLELTFPVIIQDNVYIGINTIVLPGVVIGENSIIGAGSIVTKDIPANSVYAGVPARFIKTTQDYLEKVKSESLGIGHLSAIEKANKLKEIYKIKHF